MASEWVPPDELEEYRLVRLLGRGAMGQVYLAHDKLLDRAVAVKFVRTAEDPAARARVFEEARAIARLQHPNVVAIYRVAEVDGHPYLVSEYVRGRPLDQIERPVRCEVVLQLALDLTRGLAAAHRSGVLHRDVKPANAILTDDGRGKLLDFGLARVVDGTPMDVAVAPPRERVNQARPLSAVDETMDAPRHPVVAVADSTLDSSGPCLESPSNIEFGQGSPPPEREAGTPLYMAPELWRGEPATRRSDLYALGILLYELCAGHAPHRGIPMADLADVIQNRDIPRLGTIAPAVEPALAAIIDRLVERDAGARFGSADALLVALEEIAAPTRADNVPDGNPYRGLSAFESAHGSLFFGRRGEIRELVARVTSDPFVVVGGDSGTGKSSLCRAGVLPWLVEHAGWSRVDVVPGRHPVQQLAVALASWSGLDEATLVELVRDTPDALARALRHGDRAPATRKLLLFVDQLEELLTLSDPEEARVTAAALGALAVRTPAVRVLATARSDFLSRLATLPVLGEEMGRGLYFLRPLTGEQIREAIVRPAAAKGVTFESDSLVDTLVAQTEQAPGGLPLLQFTLAELWDARDVQAKTIRTDALATLGGVEGALARHADRLLAGLSAERRGAARRLLLRLVTADGTRARRAESELLGIGPERASERAALEVLVRGRIVVANAAEQGAYEVAHEALLTSWSTFLDWRRRGAADHAARVRVEQAAAVWDRMGRTRDLLWHKRQLAEVRSLDRETMAPREVEFLAAGEQAITRRRIMRGVMVAALIAVVVAIGLTVREGARRDVEQVIAKNTAQASTAFAEARQLAAERDAARARAFALFDAGTWAEGEAAWTEVEQLAAREASRYRTASSALETALAVAPSRTSLRRQLADVLFERLVRAEGDRNHALVDELAGRLAAYDDGHYRSELDADARVELEVMPADALVYIERAGAPRTPLARRTLTLRPGHVVLAFEAPGRAVVRLPVLLARGRTSKLRVELPLATAVPPSMIYVPPGSFLFGSADSSDLRRGFLNSPPVHEVTTGAYLIGRHEVTFGEWIEFLDELPPEERRRRTPGSTTTLSSLELTELAPKRWKLTLTPTTRTYTAETGQRLHYEARTQRADQDWLRIPVAAISFEDSIAYTTWLDRTKRIPGARLCTEHEWERAARGADGRTFPNGATLAPDDANIDVTYGREPLAFGPDEVGSHPASRSPIGADDMAGNVWEWTRSVADSEAPLARGGGWYNAELSSRSANREGGEPTQRNVLMGVRVCASVTSRIPDEPAQN
ncbi:MAG: bifunctional serine/threonine-protein kinase/formylglycine-generating enzyme family protein [Kofleriaceae bacterium]|nr:bifunctional serine/threonine-protein kinase/formylglycine-generating enzyme family protein [Kofleriaceae bacterium]